MTLAADTLKTSNTIYFWTVWFSIILFVLGQLLFVGAFIIFEPQIDGLYFQIIEHRATLKTSTCFSLVLFLIPIFTTVTWRLALITSLKRKIASAFLILLFIAVGIYARHLEVKKYFTTVVKPALLTNGKTSFSYPIDPRNFVYYMFGGLIIGSLLSVILFSQRKWGKT